MAKSTPVKDNKKAAKSHKTLPRSSSTVTMATAPPKSRFTAEEEAYISSQVEAFQQKKRDLAVEEEIQNRIGKLTY